MNDCVGILIVSHSPDVAKGAAAMVEEMVGTTVPVEYCGGSGDGRLGPDVAAIHTCLERLATSRGIAVLHDFGGARMNAEMAIGLLDSYPHDQVVMCDAPVVEGAVLAASEASLGSDLRAVRAAAEEA